MSTKIRHNIMHRWEGNPILTLRDIPPRASDLYNAGCMKHEGTYYLALTVEHLQGDCAIYCARSDDGRHFTVDEEPMLSASDEDADPEYESHGVRDARMTRFGDTVYMIYLAQSPHGVRLALAGSHECGTTQRVGIISEPDTKTGALFPEKINGMYARLERPREGGNIWVSFSEDLIHWGGWEAVMTPRHGYWDYDRLGAGAPPILTEHGWLLFYHGVRGLPGGDVFRLGAAFLDRDDPTNVIGRSNIPILSPRERYERLGDVPNIVYCCGALLSDDGETVEVYYGAADSCLCLGTVALEQLLTACFRPESAERNCP